MFSLLQAMTRLRKEHVQHDRSVFMEKETEK